MSDTTNTSGNTDCAKSPSNLPVVDLSLRDYFAAKAMHALIVEPPWCDGGIATVHLWSKGFNGPDPCDRYAFDAYAMADAMIAARTQ